MVERLEGRGLVTGGAGFLARGLYRQARAEDWPVEFVCLSRDDAKHAELQQRYPEVTCIRGDVCMDVEVLAGIFAGFDFIIHAAAVKYIDRAETQAWDTVRVNVDGSRNVALAARRAQVPLVIGISTDKAVEPVNIYGMSKAVMERVFLEADQWAGSRTRFSVVRYGNVIASTGSVLAKWAAQCERGPGVASLALTNPEHSRYWMTVDEAVSVILRGASAPGLLTIYQPRAMTMRQIADAFTAQYGAQVHVVGERPGEKVDETIMSEQESLRRIEPLDDYALIAPPGAIVSESWIPERWSSGTRGAGLSHMGLLDALEEAASV